MHNQLSKSGTYKHAASDIPDAAIANAVVNGLEREIHARADHSEVVLRTIYKIPAEITHPTDVWS